MTAPAFSDEAAMRAHVIAAGLDPDGFTYERRDGVLFVEPKTVESD